MHVTDKLIVSNDIKYGMTITLDSNLSHKNEILIHGEYKVRYSDQALPKQGVLIPKHIALIVTRSGNYIATKPFFDMVVFEDDVKDDGQSVSGNFNLNVFDHIPFNGEGDYYILCSLGGYLSNIVKVVVGKV